MRVEYVLGPAVTMVDNGTDVAVVGLSQVAVFFPQQVDRSFVFASLWPGDTGRKQARSSGGERYIDTVEVGGSKPPAPTNLILEQRCVST